MGTIAQAEILINGKTVIFDGKSSTDNYYSFAIFDILTVTTIIFYFSTVKIFRLQNIYWSYNFRFIRFYRGF